MVNKFTGFIVGAYFLLFFHNFAFANSASELEKGKVLYQQCSACHGENAEGNKSLHAPALAGQFDWYLTRQLNNFANELRGAHENDVLGMQMLATARLLDQNEDVPILSAYIQSLPTLKKTFNEQGNMHNGSRYYQGKCGACHGGKAQGNQSLNAPNLSRLSKTYLQRQMLNFSNGVRGYKAEDKLGRQMAMMAKTTSGQELDDIIFYILSQESAIVSK